MSIALMTVAWKVEACSTDKLVLLALADWANESGLCWPSMKQLGDKSGLSERGLQTAIKRLIEAGHLTRHEVTGKGVNYHLHPRISRTPAQDAPPHETTQTPARRAPNTSVTIKPSVSVAAPRWHRLPVDWQPKPLPPALAAKRADWPDGWEAEALEDFRAWAANAADSNGKGRKLEWDQAWQNWLRRNDRERKPSTSNRPVGRSGQGRVLDRPRGAGTPRQQAVAEIYADLERAGYGGSH